MWWNLRSKQQADWSDGAAGTSHVIHTGPRAARPVAATVSASLPVTATSRSVLCAVEVAGGAAAAPQAADEAATTATMAKVAAKRMTWLLSCRAS